MYKLGGVVLLLLVVFFMMQTTFAGNKTAKISELLEHKKWIHGSENCESNQDPAIDVLQLDESSYILRQNKCLHYEAPFIYLLLGQHTAFLQDTGATAESELFPLYDTVNKLVTEWQMSQGIEKISLLVTHSHSHSDHKAADAQFKGKDNVIFVPPEGDAVRKFFNLTDWPSGESQLDLGGRKLTIMPLPGHQEESLAVYDRQTNLMLTGDSFYPGRLYIQDGAAFKLSMKKLLSFAQQHEVTLFLGTHIEMTNVAGKDYPMGTTYQPEESTLFLTIDDLIELNGALDKQIGLLTKQALDKVIIYPL